MHEIKVGLFRVGEYLLVRFCECICFMLLLTFIHFVMLSYLQFNLALAAGS